jgi:pilus assembly protein CpaB
VLLATAAGTATHAALAPPPPGIPVVVAGRDLATGDRLTSGDLAVVRFPAAAVPAGSVAEPSGLHGRALAAPLRRGEPVSDVRLRGDGPLRAAPEGTVATVVLLPDAATARMLAPGVRVDLLTAPVPVEAAPAPAVPVARGAVVLDVSAGGSGVLDGSLDGSGGSAGAVVAVRAGEAAAVVGAQAVAPLGVVLLP